MNCDEIFQLLTRAETSAGEKRAIDDHLAGCDECRRVKAGLAAYDEALEHPERFEGDPLPVKEAILRAARAKAAEYRRENEQTSLDGRRWLLVAAAVLLLVGAGFVAGRLSAPRRVIVRLEDEGTVGVDTSSRGGRDR